MEEENQLLQDEEEEMRVVVLRAPPTTPMLCPETWENILGYLKSKDVVVATNTCLEWREIIRRSSKSEHAAVLFPFVLPALAKYLDVNTILSCRSVNQEAKCGVDEFMKEDFGRWGDHLQIATKMTSMIEDIRVRSYVFDDATSIQNFMRIMEGSQVTDCNPFLTGSVNIFLWHCPNHQQQEVLRHFLAVYGKYVRSLIFCDISYGSFGSERRLTSFESLVWVLVHLPNLKSLKILSSGGYQQQTLYMQIVNIQLLSRNMGELCFIPGFNEEDIVPVFLLLESWMWIIKAVSLKGRLLASENTTVNRLFHSVPFLKRFEVHEICTTGLLKLFEILWQLEELQLRDSIFHPANPTAIRLLLKTLISFRTSLVTLKIFFGQTPMLKYTIGEEEMNLLVSEMTPLWELKNLSVNLACLQLSWFWKFLELSCMYLKELFLYEDEILEAKVDMVQSSKRLFTVISSLKKITVFSTRGKKETLFRRDE